MIDLFDIIKSNNLIGGFSVEELVKLLKEDSTETYSIMLVSKNRIIVRNNVTNQLEKLECIGHYFDISAPDCQSIKDCIGCPQSGNCKDCFKKALEMLEEGKLNKK